MTGAQLNFGAAKLTVAGAFDPDAVLREARRENLRALPAGVGGPKASADGGAGFWERHRAIALAMMAGTAVLAAWTLERAGAGTQPPASVAIHALYLAAVALGGHATLRKGVAALGRLRFDMNALMTVAVTGALLIGERSEAAMVAFLYGVSEALESRSIDRARRSIRALVDLSPREATVRRGGRETRVPVEQVEVGELFIVRPGEKIALDGRVRAGGSSVDQTAITGESMPVEKEPGADVFAGTLNGEGSLEVEATRRVADTTLARIIHLVEEAQSQRAPAQAFVDRFAAVYTPVVIIVAALTVTVPPLFLGQAWEPWIYRGLALIVAACPCALVVSTPVALLTAIGTAARHGVLIKGGRHLENVGRLRAIAFDKTGTLTSGRPAVTDVIGAGGRDEDEVLRVAAAVEVRSEHPLAGAVVRHARERGLPIPAAEDFRSVPGKGARARVDGRTVYVGNARWLAGLSGGDAAVTPAPARLQAEGKTVIMVGTDTELLGLIALADTPRPASRAALAALRRAGVERVAMLTGDNAATAAAVARAVGIDEVRADLLPHDKVAAVRELAGRYGRVGMVGDGVNDAPALAASTVGFAMAGAGNDAALQTADVALIGDDLSRLPFAMRLSRAALAVIRQNIAFSLAVKAAAVFAVYPGWMTLWLAILADMGATILVTLNAIRLVAWRPERDPRRPAPRAARADGAPATR